MWAQLITLRMRFTSERLSLDMLLRPRTGST
jgi:hypothetical protein